MEVNTFHSEKRTDESEPAWTRSSFLQMSHNTHTCCDLSVMQVLSQCKYILFPNSTVDLFSWLDWLVSSVKQFNTACELLWDPYPPAELESVFFCRLLQVILESEFPTMLCGSDKAISVSAVLPEISFYSSLSASPPASALFCHRRTSAANLGPTLRT